MDPVFHVEHGALSLQAFHVERLAALMPPASEVEALLARGLVALGLEQADPGAWATLARLLDRWSQRINLTGHRGPTAIAERLLLEAAALARALPPAGRIADLGSGAGIPGLPIALCRPQTEVLLVEARERRHHFQRAAIRALGLSNARALHGRAESLTPLPSDGVIAQAFARPDQALALMRPWAGERAWIALATSPGSHIECPNGLREPRRVPYAAPAGPARELWIARVAYGIKEDGA